MQKPLPSEFPPYFKYYIDLVEEGHFFQLLDENTAKTIDFYNKIPLEKHDFKYHEDKWSIKEVLMHVIDSERAFAYRAFVAGRRDDETILFGMDENKYNKNIDVQHRTMDSLLKEFEIVRNNSKVLLENITEENSTFLAQAKTHQISARALGYIMIGHAKHHSKIVSERYL